MSLNPFATVSDYPSMLNKIALFTFFVSLLVLGLIYWQLGGFPGWIPALLVKIPETDLQVPLSVLLLAAVFAVLSRIIKLHDRLSDGFQIRKRFDVECILLPMAAASGVALSLQQQEAVRNKRESLMGDTFYKYVSSTPGKAQIDQHAITMALDQWSWYWICEEAAFLIVLGSLYLALRAKVPVAFLLLLTAFLLIWLLQVILQFCKGYARDEVKLILDEPSRRTAVRGIFNAL